MSDEEIINSIIEEQKKNGVTIPKNFKVIVENGFDSVQEFYGYLNNESGTNHLLQHHTTTYISKENIKKLNKIINFIQVHMKYAPGGQGAQDVKNDFYHHAALQKSMARGRSIKTKRRRSTQRRRSKKRRRPTKRRRAGKSSRAR